MVRKDLPHRVMLFPMLNLVPVMDAGDERGLANRCMILCLEMQKAAVCLQGKHLSIMETVP